MVGLGAFGGVQTGGTVVVDFCPSEFLLLLLPFFKDSAWTEGLVGSEFGFDPGDQTPGQNQNVLINYSSSNEACCICNW